MRSGAQKERVTLQNPGAKVPDGDGGYTQTYAPFLERVPAKVEAATARNLERVIANSVQAQASHLVTVRYNADTTTESRVVWHHRAGDKTLSVTGVHDDGNGVELVLACNEAVA